MNNMPITTTTRIKHAEISNCASKIRKRVSFSTIHIRLYETAMSYNPSCSVGPALELGWNYTKCDTYILDDYEAMKPSQTRRNSKELIISFGQRESILKSVGYSRRQIENCILIIETSKAQRRNSIKSPSNPFSKLFHTIPKPIMKRQFIKCAA